MDGVQRIVYPRPDRPQDGWMSFVPRTTGIAVAVSQLQRADRTTVRRVASLRPESPQDGWVSYVERTAGINLKWTASAQLWQSCDALDYVLGAHREQRG